MDSIILKGLANIKAKQFTKTLTFTKKTKQKKSSAMVAIRVALTLVKKQPILPSNKTKFTLL